MNTRSHPPSAGRPAAPGWRLSWSFAAALALVVATALAPVRAALQDDGQRVALVVGNSAYVDAPLKNPVNDARAMARSLEELGFSVKLLLDADHAALEQGIVDFGASLDKDAAALFYYAGHGLQVRGRNYLVPVDASFSRENEVRIGAVDVDLVLSELEWAGSRVNIVILDACRNNPFERSFRGSASRGLAAIDAARGTVVAYATAPGAVAADGAGSNGVYTSELLEALREPGLSVEEVFKRVRVGVAEATRDQQIPWESSSLTGDFVFNVAAPEPEPEVAPAGGAVASAPGRSGEADALFWESIKDSADPVDFRLYLDAFPEGLFARLADRQIAKLDRAAVDVSESRNVDRRAEEADRLLALAQADITALRLTSPAGNNAVEKLREVLAIDPENVSAHEGLARVVARYLELADRSVNRSNFDAAEGYVAKAESVSPGSEAIVIARTQVEQARAREADATRARRAAAEREAARTREARAAAEREADAELAAIREELAGLKREQRTREPQASEATAPAAREPRPAAAPARTRAVILPGRVTASYSAGTTHRSLQQKMKGVARVLRREGNVELVFSPTDEGADAALEARLDGLWTGSQANPAIDVSRALPVLRSMKVDVAIAIHLISGYSGAGRTRVEVLDARTGKLGSVTLHLGNNTMMAAVRKAYGEAAR